MNKGAVIILMWAVAGCNAKTESGDFNADVSPNTDNESDTAEDTDAEADADADADADVDNFSVLYTSFFEPECATCHGGLDPTADFDMNSASVAYTELMPLVVLGDAESSYIIHKLRGDDGIYGGAMPPSDGATPQQIAAISAWINAGAPE